MQPSAATFLIFLNLVKIDLPRGIYANFRSEIRILSAIRALFTQWLNSPPPPPPLCPIYLKLCMVIPYLVRYNLEIERT